MYHRALLLIASLVALGCAARTPPPRTSSADLDAWTSAEAAAPLRSATTLRPASIPESPPDRWRSQTIAAVITEPPRPRRGARVDVSFHRSDMTSAFQLLADVGRFNLVMAEGLTGQVSATLRGIDPYDALKAVAEANGVEARYEGGVVVVKKR
jgi:type IV pilus assembly protein PilQ